MHSQRRMMIRRNDTLPRKLCQVAKKKKIGFSGELIFSTSPVLTFDIFIISFIQRQSIMIIKIIIMIISMILLDKDIFL